MHKDFIFGTYGLLQALEIVLIDKNENKMGGFVGVKTTKLYGRFRLNLDQYNTP